MHIGILKESLPGERRVAVAPGEVARLKALAPDVQVWVEKDAGKAAGYLNEAYEAAGAELVTTAKAWGAACVLRINAPTADEAEQLAKGGLLICLLEPHKNQPLLDQLAKQGVSAIALERIPRTSRAQAMDVLSSQANIAGYRAVLEAATLLPRFFPLMMTAAGSAKPARVAVLGAGVAGLQAIATARRLGAIVEGFDIRPEVGEQITSLGAKVMDLGLAEEGRSEGGYAKELSAEGKERQQAALQEKLASFDVIITTAQIPGRAAPLLVTAEAVQNMRAGTVIVDLAASSGGNCPLTEADKVVVKHGVTLVGHTNYPAMVAADASTFFGRNLSNLLKILVIDGKLNLNLEDDIIAAALLLHEGQNRADQKGMGK